jgi:DtxR family Mn-dependent transcriptional regulator
MFMSLSHTEENYLKTIFRLQSDGPNPVSTGELASSFGIQAPSVTDMVKKLAAKKMLRYEKSRGVRLTEKGKKSALIIIRKHRIWETFLVQTLDFGWDEVHDLAEQLEHIDSEQLTDRLERFLGFPRFDPHGDPIPDKSGKLEPARMIELSRAEEGKHYVIAGIRNDGAGLLQYLNKLKVNIGTKIYLDSREPFDHSVHIKVDKGPRANVSVLVAESLMVAEA